MDIILFSGMDWLKMSVRPSTVHVSCRVQSWHVSERNGDLDLHKRSLKRRLGPTIYVPLSARGDTLGLIEYTFPLEWCVGSPDASYQLIDSGYPVLGGIEKVNPGDVFTPLV